MMSMGVTDPGQSEVETDITGDELAPGTKLSNGTYTIVEHLKSGGFGITYLALDTLGRRVVIKECFPSGMCARPQQSVRPRSRTYETNISKLIEKFVAEAHSLAKVNHPNIVKVHQVFLENNTAYMALDYVEGVDLLEAIEDTAKALSPGEVRSMLLKLLDAIGAVHETGILHRDISPDNVLLDAKRNPILIDFGAAREQAVAGGPAASTLHVVKDGYSPQELYLATGHQGPWSDLYGLAATFYHVITGKAPTNSQERLAALAGKSPDPLEPLAGRFPAYDAAFLAAIDKALAILPRDRLQSAQQWIAAVSGGKVLQLPVSPSERPATAEPISPAVPATDTHTPKAKIAVAAGAVAVALLIAGVFIARPSADTGSAADQPAGVSAPASDIATAEPVETPSVAAAPETSAPPPIDPAEAPAATARDSGGVDVASEASGTDTPDTAMAEAGAATGTDQSAEAADGPVQRQWTAKLPFGPSDARPNVIGTVADGAPGWLVPGLEISAVNGVEVRGIAEIPDVLRGTVDPGEAQTITVTLDVSTAGAPPEAQSLDLAVQHNITLGTGTQFAVYAVDQGWQTEVVILPAAYSGEMQVGDILAGHVESNTKFDGPGDLVEMLNAAIANGAVSTTVAVMRGEEMWVASLPLAN